MNECWETEIGGLLTELADVQSALLETLHEKRRILATSDHQALTAMAAREQQLLERLQACQEQRQQLLSRAEAEGLPADSMRSLSNQLPAESRGRVQASIREAADRSRLLQHQSLTNWVLVQRTLLHLSQMIEIIATGGRPRPTYGKGSERAPSGALVDRAA
ncbi:MAG: flagellar protein FlgN [Planctomycetes bacterium]|nr:flagellar protein FlgN [Planctomycetota bacterium]